jgi:predicted O-linked N-acetylglucosamine transferase (SPINDLY family)
MATVAEAMAAALRHYRAGERSQAEQLCRQILQVEPGHVPALYLLGNTLAVDGRLAEAVEIYARAVQIDPRNQALSNNLAAALAQVGRRQEAIAVLERAVAIEPAAAELPYNLGNFLRDEGRLGEAIAAYERALQIRPDYVQACNNLGQANHDLGRLGEAIAILERALQIQPDYAKAHTNLGVVLHEAGQVEESLAELREGLRLEPNQPLAHSKLLFCLHYSPDLDQDAVYQEHRRWNESFAHPLANQIKPHGNDRDPDRRLRIGYVSANFCEHPVAFFLEPILAHHDHAQLELCCFSNTARADDYTWRIRTCADRWYDIRNESDDQVAERIRAERIDILIDLTQHMVGNRLLVFARKPAPVQISYLGYPGTTGLESIDYRLSDPYLDPPGWNEAYNSEQLLRLPRSYFCYQPPADSPPVPPLPARGTGRITFGCFNTLAKLNRRGVGLWARVLQAVPGSRLVLKARGLADAAIQAHVQNLFADEGIGSERLELHGWNRLSEYLTELGSIDIGLDPLPYSAGTSTCHTLWMGVPVISVAGRSAVSRMGLSVLANAGLQELVAETPEQYVALATRLARDLERLDALRQGLRQRMVESPLLDAERFARELEALYRQVWRQWVASQE